MIASICCIFVNVKGPQIEVLKASSQKMVYFQNEFETETHALSPLHNYSRFDSIFTDDDCAEEEETVDDLDSGFSADSHLRCGNRSLTKPRNAEYLMILLPKIRGKT